MNTEIKKNDLISVLLEKNPLVFQFFVRPSSLTQLDNFGFKALWWWQEWADPFGVFFIRMEMATEFQSVFPALAYF